MWIRVFFLLFSSFGLFCIEGQITLQEHQNVPVKYLMQHPEQKGLLLYHSLGSGKTYAALDYCEKNKDKKVVLFLPTFLKSNWNIQLKSFGVKDPSRYEMISFNEIDKLLSNDLSHKIVIVDEAHKLVQGIRSIDTHVSEKFIQAYEKIQSSDKLLLLTGTPLFIETSDIAFLANALLGKPIYPVDNMKFKIEFTKIKPVTSLLRGHVTESKMVLLGVPFFVTLSAAVCLATTAPWSIPLAALAGGALVPVINELYPVKTVNFREFDADKWKDFASKYISYYQVHLGEDENYPAKEIITKKSLYNDYQVNFFLSFVDEELSIEQLKMLMNDQSLSYSDAYIMGHSSYLQKQLLLDPLSGRDIGNFSFKEKNQAGQEVTVDSPKFKELLKIIQEKPGQVVIYSNYYQNGILKLMEFFNRNGMSDQYIFLSPEQSVEEQSKHIQIYNEGKKRILFIHPEITEGISLQGTEQLHILEPVSNSCLMEQIIGRAIRYKSHLHLPAQRRKVSVYLWESYIDYNTAPLIPSSAGIIRREHWQRKYSEVNPSMWTMGIVALDNNYFLKDETPDGRTKRTMGAFDSDLKSFQGLLENYSIERTK